ncbi:MAG: hypothetical protein CVU46_11020 [Chloroflexi bacterium HGW-Chloroflexi-8]|nr:MAG: hypothetical protein CVU46_11020 [Chloroflexi bacterium HGW-Chloroflexi-8]
MNTLIKRTAPTKEVIDKEFSIADTYSALEFYYHNNGVYALLQQDLIAEGLWTEGMSGLRNPAHRTVEFYVSKLWPGALPKALPIVAKNTKIIEPIEQIWKWSNFGSMKQVFSRWFSLFGDGFIKVASRNGSDGKASQVYFQNIKPTHVTELKLDDRNYVTKIRIDIPQIKTDNGKITNYYHTEIWDKNTQLFRVWESEKGPGTSENRLGTPITQKSFTAFGIDFVPIVHAKFQDIGETRGAGCFVHALDKIDEANRMATRLHQLLYRFNDVTWAIRANGMDSSGRPLPAPTLNLGESRTADDQSTIKISTGTKVARLPGNSELQSLVPDLHYSDALAILDAHMLELERDLPEMAYYRLREQGKDLSGIAIRYLLSDAVDKALEARGNAETALIRADEMALSMAQGMEIFKNLGNYEAGDFDHIFADREIIPLSEKEKREIAVMDDSLGVSRKTNLSKLGYDPDLEALQKKDEDSDLGEQILSNFDKGK